MRLGPPRFGKTQRHLLREEQTRAWLRSVVRSGLIEPERIERELSDAIRTDLPHLSPEVAPAWVADSFAEWAHDAANWPSVMDYDRLQAAFDQLEREHLPVLVGCEDHWAATAVLKTLPPEAEGLLWFTPLDVWHAVDEPMLEVNIWSRQGVNQREGAPLVQRAITACAAEGLEAHFDEGRLEIAARWQPRARR